jgi:integrase
VWITPRPAYALDNQAEFGVSSNPLRVTPLPAASRQRSVRERTLSDDELALVWLALDREWATGWKFIAPWQRLVLLTAQRPGEVLSMKRGHRFLEFNQDGTGWWTLERLDTKNKKSTVRVPLSRPAVLTLKAWLDWQDAEGRSSPYAFPLMTPRKDRDHERPFHMDTEQTNARWRVMQRVGIPMDRPGRRRVPRVSGWRSMVRTICAGQPRRS